MATKSKASNTGADKKPAPAKRARARATKNATDVWAEIDSTLIRVKGKRVWWFPSADVVDPHTGKNSIDANEGDPKAIAKVIACPKGLTDEHGRDLDRLKVTLGNGSEIIVLARLDSAREPGTYDLAKPGDLTE